MARSAKFNIDGDASGVRRATIQADKSLNRLNKTADKGAGSFAKYGKQIGLAAGVGAAAGLALFSKNAVTAAADAAEVDSKLQVVFGKTLPGVAKQLKDFSKVTAASNTELRQQAADMGALLGPMLKSKDAAAKMSVATAKLATDLGSFNNVPVADALESIRAGLVGEAEPLRKFGVLLNAATVNQEAMRATGKKHVEQLTEQEKVQARYTLIMQQTAQAHGDAARTADSTANRMKELKSNFKDISVELGTAMLPAFTKVLGGMMRLIEWGRENWPRFKAAVLEAVRPIVAWFRENWPQIQKTAKDVFQSIKTNWETFGKPIFSALVDVVKGIVKSFQENWPAISEQAGKTWKELQPILIPLRDLLIAIIDKGLKPIGKQAGPAFLLLLKGIQAVAATINAIVTGINTGIQKTIDLYNAMKNLGKSGGLSPAIQRAIDAANAASRGASPLPGAGATGGVVGGRGRGDTVPAMLTPGEVVLNARQQSMLGRSSIMSVLSQTGGKIGLGGFASGGVAALVAPALSFARAQVGDAYGRPDRFPPRSRTGPDTWDCSGYASTVASKIKGYRGGIGTTMTLGPASRRARGNEPVVFGFRGGFGGNSAHMGIRVLGQWFDSGSGGVQRGDSNWSSLGIPPGLEYLSNVQTVAAKDPKAAKQGRPGLIPVVDPKYAKTKIQKNNPRAAAGDTSLGVYSPAHAAPVTTGAYNEDARGIGRTGAPTIGYTPPPGAAIVPETVTDSTPVEPVPDPGPSADDKAMRDRLLQIMDVRTRSDATNRAFGNTMGASNDLFGGMAMLALGDARSLSAWADQTSKSLYTQGAISPGRVGIGV